jgi:hypothetical protein
MKPYNKVYGIEKRESEGILDGQIVVQEKYDGSMLRIEIKNGEMILGSHHVDNINEGDGQFRTGIQEAKNVFGSIKEDINIFCEYLPREKTNTIQYKTTPPHYLIVFDVFLNNQWLKSKELKEFATKFGLHSARVMWEGSGKDFTKEIAESLLKQESSLGNAEGYSNIEGIVIKNYDKYYDSIKFPWLSGFFMCSKWVNSDFKEKNIKEHPTNKNQVDNIIEMYRSNKARWQKALQHLEEQGKLSGEMKDLALLIPEVKRDLVEEEKEEIKESLYKIFSPKILGVSTIGLAEWYKNYLIKKSGNI